MKSKIFGLLSLSVLATVMLMSFAFATITISNPTLSQTGTSATITISSDQNEAIDFSGLSTITESGKTITFNPISSIVINDTDSQTITLNYVIQSGFDFYLGKTYSTTLTASGDTSPNVSQALSFEVTEDLCDASNPSGNIKVSIKDISNKGISDTKFGDDNEWFPLDSIELEIEVENKGDEKIKNIEVEWGLYDKDTGEFIIDDKESDFDLKHNKDETITIKFDLDDVNDFEDGGDYALYVWATGEDQETELDVCSADSESITIEIENDFVVLYDIEFLETVTCGAELQITAEVWNIGDDNQEDVSVLINSNIPGLSTRNVDIGDVDAFSDEKLDITMQIPQDTPQKDTPYVLYFSVLNDGDIYENDYDDDESKFSLPLYVGDCAAKETKAIVSAELESGGKAGEELVIKATVTNTGDDTATYSINAAGYTPWASSADLDEKILTLDEGESADVLMTFEVKSDASGENTFEIEVVSENQLITTQEVSVDIESKGFSLGGDLFGDNWYLWGIGLLNIILVVIIIIVAVRVARK